MIDHISQIADTTPKRGVNVVSNEGPLAPAGISSFSVEVGAAGSEGFSVSVGVIVWVSVIVCVRVNSCVGVSVFISV
jgi:hypothetical protein